ncbi:MAG: DUF1385 domain-containing protein [Eubacterium sp.]|nr:DUF1385 domain-containing protein [Eubacterium sp.]
MDLSKIFLKDACPTMVGGQAVMEGVMMRGQTREAVTIRLPDGRTYIRSTPRKKSPAVMKLPFVRGVVAFVMSLVSGMSTLTFSADVLEYFTEDETEETDNAAEKQKEGVFDRFERRMVEKYGEQKVWNVMMAFSVVIALVIAIGVFVLLPTLAVSALKGVIASEVVLNIIEGLLRLAMFVLYIVAVSHMKEIRRVFEYHGAEHKTIHCFENGLELVPENADDFYTLHPRCGTSFLMFVMVISLVLFSLLGWPNLAARFASRILLMPVVAGISFELLRWAGRSDNIIVKVLSIPGLLLQKITTNEPDHEELEIAMISMKAVLAADRKAAEGALAASNKAAGETTESVDETSAEAAIKKIGDGIFDFVDPEVHEGFCDKDGNIIEPFDIEKAKKERENR